LLLVPLRTWTDSAGKHSTQAELADYKGGTVYLHLRDGRIKLVPIERLSVQDQEHVRAEHPFQTLDGEVVGLADGDTLILLDAQKTQHKIRLEGIDAPESKQEFGTQSRKALGNKIIRKTVRVEWNERDRYDRVLGHVILDGRWINQEHIADGWAWHYKQYNDSAVLAEAETKAREAKLGLWAKPNPIAPWDFRNPPKKRGPPDPLGEASFSDSTELAQHLDYSQSESDETVWINDTSPRYHRADCKYLKGSDTPVLLSEVDGLYPPCKVCHPELVRPLADKPEPDRRPKPRPSYNRPRQQVFLGPVVSPPSALGGYRGGSGYYGTGGGPVRVRGHYRDGHWVQPYSRRAPSR
jgi:endonuclease YncB( thermonuclease family)